MASIDWKNVREKFLLDPDVVQLNAGSFGAHPKAVFDAVTEIRRLQATSPTHFQIRLLPDLLWNARERLAQFLGTDASRLIFTTNVSIAINLVASGIHLPKNGEILMTDHEYGAMQWCWERAAARNGLTIQTFPLPTMPRDEGEIVDAAAKAMTSKTRLFFFSHALSPTGLILPAKELCAAARKRGILSVVDGAHAPMMIDLDLQSIGADYYAGNCHKWLHAPIGAGFLVVGQGREESLAPLQVSWGYHPDAYMRGEIHPDRPLESRDPYGSTQRIRPLEFEGTRDVGPWLALPAAIDFQTSLGLENVRNRYGELSRVSRTILEGKLGFPATVPEDRRFCGAMTSFRLPDGTNIQDLKDHLWKDRIEIPLIPRPDHLMIRISHPCFTLPEEIERLGDSLRTFYDPHVV